MIPAKLCRRLGRPRIRDGNLPASASHIGLFFFLLRFFRFLNLCPFPGSFEVKTGPSTGYPSQSIELPVEGGVYFNISCLTPSKVANRLSKVITVRPPARAYAAR